MALRDVKVLSNAFSRYLKEVRTLCDLIPHEQRIAIIKRYKANGDESDLDIIARSMLRLVIKEAISCARSFRAFHFVEDLVQEGNLGLLRAIQLFDANRGVRLATYATYWIRQRLWKFLNEHKNGVHVPAHRQEQFKCLWRVSSYLEQKLGRQPSDEEIVEAGMDPNILRRLRKTPFNGVVSLDEAVFEGKNGKTKTRKEFIASDDSEGFFAEALESLWIREALCEFLDSSCSPREARMMKLRFGLDGDEPMTLQQIGDMHRLTRERARQIIDKVLHKPSLRSFFTHKLMRNGHNGKPHMALTLRNEQELASSHPATVVLNTLRTENGNNGDAREVVRCPECGTVQYVSRHMRCRNSLCRAFFVRENETRAFCETHNAFLNGNGSIAVWVGSRIKYLREARNMTQGELCTLSGHNGAKKVSRSYLCRIESGQITPSLGILEKIAQALNVGLGCFFVPDSDPTWIFLDPFIQKLQPFWHRLDCSQRQSAIRNLWAVMPQLRLP